MNLRPTWRRKTDNTYRTMNIFLEKIINLVLNSINLVIESTIKLLLDRKIKIITSRTISLFWGRNISLFLNRSINIAVNSYPVVSQMADIFREMNGKEFLAMTCDRGLTSSDMIL